MATIGICYTIILRYVLLNVTSIYMIGHVTVRASHFLTHLEFTHYTVHVLELHYSALQCSTAPYRTIHYLALLYSV